MKKPSLRQTPVRHPIWSCVGFALSVLASATLSFAGPPKAKGFPPKPPPRVADPAPSAAPADAGASPTTAAPDAGAAQPASAVDPSGAPAGLDGGVRVSPLNPGANEFPSRNGGDAGTPPSTGIDYDRLLADVAALRARIAMAQDALFRSRAAISVKLDGKHAKLSRLVVSLDDGAVYTAPTGFRPEDFTTVYDHAVAPGKHAVTIDIERKDDRDEGFRSSQRSRVIVDVPKEQRLELEVLLIDESDMGGDFPSDKSGRYDLRVRFKATAKGAK